MVDFLLLTLTVTVVWNTQEASWANSNVFKRNLQYSAYRQVQSDKFPV
jgi:hypothetical protein